MRHKQSMTHARKDTSIRYKQSTTQTGEDMSNQTQAVHDSYPQRHDLSDISSPRPVPVKTQAIRYKQSTTHAREDMTNQT